MPTVYCSVNFLRNYWFTVNDFFSVFLNLYSPAVCAIMDKKEIDALITLLDDPDEKIFSQVKDKLLQYGKDIIPKLEIAWETQLSGNQLFQNRIENIIHDIQFDAVYSSLLNWANSGGADLLEAMLLISKYQYPDLDEDKIRKYINQVERDVWLELNQNLTALEKVNVMNHILFGVHVFTGNRTNYHAPQNSYLSDMTETKKGNPLSLSALYLIIAQKLDLPVFGVNLPNHFILAYVDFPMFSKNHIPILLAEKEHLKVLFYINPFSKGTALSRQEVENFIKQLKLKPKGEYFQPCDNITIVRRMINNLINSYQKLGYPDKVEELKKLSEAVGGLE